GSRSSGRASPRGLPPAAAFAPAAPPRTARRKRRRGRPLRPSCLPGVPSLFVEGLLNLGEFEQERRQLLLVLIDRHGRLVVLQFIDGLFQFFLLVEQRPLDGIARRARVRAQAHQRKRGGQAAFPVFRVGTALAF